MEPISLGFIGFVIAPTNEENYLFQRFARATFAPTTSIIIAPPTTPLDHRVG